MRVLLRSFQTVPLRYLLAYVVTVYVLTLYPFNFFQRNNVRHVETGLSFDQPGTAYTRHAHPDLSYLYQFTFLLHVTSQMIDPGHTARIMCSGTNFWDQNFSIAQWHSALNVQFFSRDSKQFNELTILDVFKRTRPTWIALTFNGTTLRCYIDGVKKDDRRTGPMALTQWDSAAPIVFGTDPAGTQQWEGVVHTAAIFDRVFKVAELRHPDLIFKKYSSIIHYDFRHGGVRSIPSSGSDRDSVVVPELYKPFNRSTWYDSFRLLGRQRLYVRDIVANIIFFLPVGLFSALAFRRNGHSLVSSTVLSVLIGLALSVSIESLQIYLPSRYSSMIDIVSNTLGAALGAGMAMLFGAFAEESAGTNRT